MAAYHKNPNVGQVLLWRAWSMGMTAKYFVLLTSKRVIIVPLKAQAMARHSDSKTTLVYFHNLERISLGAEKSIKF